MQVIIIGDGGHSKVIQEMIKATQHYELIAILDDKYEQETIRGGLIYGPISLLTSLIDVDIKVIVAIGNNQIRKQLAEHLILPEEQYATVIHPTAVVSPSATIGKGTVVMPNAVINAEATIGNHCIINTAVTIEHDCALRSFTHASPNATITGNVSIGEGVHIGAAATIIPGVNIGDWTVIGAGSTVIQSIPANVTVVGSPTRIVNT